MTEPAGPARSGAPAVVAAVLVGAWTVGVTLAVQALGWTVEQVLSYYTGGRPGWLWPVASLVNAVLVAGPAALLAWLPTQPAVRAAGRAWLAGASAAGLLGAVRAAPGAEAELHLALLALAAAILAFAWRDRRCSPPQERARAVWLAVAAGLAVLSPWLWVGALGGLLETVLALVAAAALGWLAGAVLSPRFWEPFRGGGRVRLVLGGGAAAGVALLLVAAGAGASGSQLPSLLVLPALGFGAAALAPARSAWPVRALVSLAVLGPLALVDPEEVSLLLTTTRDVPFWAGVATAAALAAAALLGAGLTLGLRPAPGDPSRWSGYRTPAPSPAGGVPTGTDLGFRWPRWTAVLLAGALAVAAVGGYAGAGQPGLHGERLFVVLAGQPDLSGLPDGTGQAGRDARAREVYHRLVAHAGRSQADLRADLDRWGLGYTPYYLVNAVEVTGGPAVRAWLAGRDDVDRVLRSQELRPLPGPGSPLAATAGLDPDRPEWNVAMLRADRVWEELAVTGAGVTIGTSDSGVDGTHPALAGGFRDGGDSWLDPAAGSPAPTDRHGHGTHTLGSALGRGGIGVAPGAGWAGCRNLDRGLGNPGRYLACLQFLLAPYPAGGDPWRDGDPRRAPQVLTNSWGCPPIEGCDPGVLRPATAALRAAGIYTVVAAGNAGPFCGSVQDPPATHPDVLTVGAVDRERAVATFSSRGEQAGSGKPDLVAPGAEVVSAVPGGGYRAQSGTSTAAPQVAGVVALMWSANPELVGDLAATDRILAGTARPVTGDGSGCPGGGAGLVDAYAAVQAAQAATG